jgi:hypothetical protein
MPTQASAALKARRYYFTFSGANNDNDKNEFVAHSAALALARWFFL